MIIKTMNEFFSRTPQNIDINIEDLENTSFSVYAGRRKFSDCTIDKKTGKSILVKTTTQHEGEVKFWIPIETFVRYRKGNLIMLPGILKINLLTPDLKPLKII